MFEKKKTNVVHTANNINNNNNNKKKRETMAKYSRMVSISFMRDDDVYRVMDLKRTWSITITRHWPGTRKSTLPQVTNVYYCIRFPFADANNRMHIII